MGIHQIWDIIGEGDITSLAALSTKWLREHGRPLRIAIDEAGWRFKNLNEAQVTAIRQTQAAANPVEKAIFFRILGLLRLNIELFFVFDGPRRPAKRGGHAGGRMIWPKLALTKKVLTKLRVPYHEAPAEAEAECATLQQQGLVDAVWSDDSDTLMFGCGMLIRTHYEKGNAGRPKKSQSHVRIYHASEIQLNHQISRNDFVLFAMLVGGDYNTSGLQRCGPQKAMRLVKAGLSNGLCAIQNENDRQEWRDQLMGSIQGDIEVPANFPDMKVLLNYRSPLVSADDKLHSLRGLKDHEMRRAVDEVTLRSFIKQTFNIRTKEYIRHIIPWLLVRRLAGVDSVEPSWIAACELQIKMPKRKKSMTDSAAGAPVALEKTITFLPQPITTHNLTVVPTGDNEEDWSELATKTHGPFDPLARTECDLLTILIERGAPAVIASGAQAIEARQMEEDARATTRSAPKSRKRKAVPEDTVDAVFGIEPSVSTTHTSRATVAHIDPTAVKRTKRTESHVTSQVEIIVTHDQPNSIRLPSYSSRQMPLGKKNCLSSQSFFLAGIHATMDAPDLKQLINVYGGKVHGSLQKKTTIAVIGDAVDAKTLQAIVKAGCETIDEQELFHRIRGTTRPAAPAIRPPVSDTSMVTKTSPASRGRNIFRGSDSTMTLAPQPVGTYTPQIIDLDDDDDDLPDQILTAITIAPAARLPASPPNRHDPSNTPSTITLPDPPSQNSITAASRLDLVNAVITKYACSNFLTHRLLLPDHAMERLNLLKANIDSIAPESRSAFVQEFTRALNSKLPTPAADHGLRDGANRKSDSQASVTNCRTDSRSTAMSTQTLPIDTVASARLDASQAKTPTTLTPAKEAALRRRLPVHPTSESEVVDCAGSNTTSIADGMSHIDKPSANDCTYRYPTQRINTTSVKRTSAVIDLTLD